MWTFKNVETENRTISAMSWNHVNHNIIAVGYGKYHYSESLDGLVCCWSVKNPCQPERMFRLPNAVTSLSFSKSQPNLLAIGCYNGDLYVMNVASSEPDFIILNREKEVATYSPLWKVLWFYRTDFVTESEEIITAGQSGMIRKWSIAADYPCYELIKLKYSRRNGDDGQNGTVGKITLRLMAGLSLTLHPTNRTLFYVVTEEGYLALCSTTNRDQYMSIIPGHIGPIYGIYHSPFCPHIFVTHGADWNICIWAENVAEPLIKLHCAMDAVNDVAWSPTHSTFLTSVSGNSAFLWDIGRKIVTPLMTVNVSTTNLTTVVFSPSGKNILVGDVTGNVHVYSLTEVPDPPYLQREALIRSLENALVSKPEMLKKLRDAVAPT